MNKDKNPLKITAIKTSLFKLGQDLEKFILDHLSSYHIQEGTLLAITSKLFSLAENRVAHQTSDKVALIQQEADEYLGEGGHGFHLSIKEGLMMASSGIDQSNSPTGDFLLLPKNPYNLLQKLHKSLKKKLNLKTLGLLMTDSHTTPLRRGVLGVGLAYYGFQAIDNQIGEEDLFGRELKVTTINNVDALSAAAVWIMGEGNDQTPLALIEGASLQWQDHSTPDEIKIPLEEDLYRILFQNKKK